ncbi:uncharacterized protein LOC110995070 [Pieris rapae]|uniref:uncharacterized protein LOC110995070 n=1 Tax=Pieris rapae TaxID=64459 RepID=UPI001E27B975|nr:uncharacterized protein LOC110995070 [Pieris rapae]
MAFCAVDFVRIIEQYPCLYNYTLAEYSRKDVTDQAWSEVSHLTNTSVPECQVKWRNIRNGFVRSLKSIPHGKQKKLYHLHDEMQFIVPFLKTLVPEKTNPKSDDEPVEIEVEPLRIEKPSATISNFKRRKIKKYKLERPDFSWIKNIRNENPRKMFLLSLLPDVEKLTEEQMRKFRIKMLLLLEDIQMETEDTEG